MDGWWDDSQITSSDVVIFHALHFHTILYILYKILYKRRYTISKLFIKARFSSCFFHSFFCFVIFFLWLARVPFDLHNQNRDQHSLVVRSWVLVDPKVMQKIFMKIPIRYWKCQTLIVTMISLKVMGSITFYCKIFQTYYN